MNIVLGLLIGIAFGFIIHRVGASQYENILNTLRLKNLKVLKFMVLAIAVGMAGIYALNIFGLAHFGIKPTYILGVSLGGLIFGIGFAVGGYCPGTALCALGEGKKDAFFTIIGGLLGALVYAFVYPVIKPLLIDPLNYGKITFADVLSIPPIAAAAVFAVILAVTAYLLQMQKLKIDTLTKELHFIFRGQLLLF